VPNSGSVSDVATGQSITLLLTDPDLVGQQPDHTAQSGDGTLVMRVSAGEA
jgi:hypothetical protein